MGAARVVPAREDSSDSETLRPAIWQRLQATKVGGAGKRVRTAPGLDPGLHDQQSCGEGGQATGKVPLPMNIVSTALGKIFYYKILQVGAGLSPSLWALARSLTQTRMVVGVSEGPNYQNKGFTSWRPSPAVIG